MDQFEQIKNNKYFIPASITIAITIIIILYFIFTWNTQLNEDYLYGSWLATDDDFCDTSGIESMQIFIGPAENNLRTITRNCYLVICNDIANTDFTMTYVSAWTSPNIGEYKINADLKFSDETCNLIANNVNITIDIRTGVLKMFDNNTMYAVLTKQNDVTNLTRNLEDADMIE